MANPSEDLRRRQAFEDYYKLNLIGKKRNVNTLYEWYIQRFHDDPTDRPNIPTTNRATLYNWSKEDKWSEQVKIREFETIDKSAKTYEDLRMHGYDKLNLMISTALNTLEELARPLKSGQRRIDDKVRLQATLAILDRVGITPGKGDPRHQVGNPVQEKREDVDDLPDLSQDDETLIAYLSGQLRKDKES